MAGHLPTKIARRAGHLSDFFKCLGYARGFARGGCLWLELTRTLTLSSNVPVDVRVLKAHTNGPNIAGACCVRLHGPLLFKVLSREALI